MSILYKKSLFLFSIFSLVTMGTVHSQQPQCPSSEQVRVALNKAAPQMISTLVGKGLTINGENWLIDKLGGKLHIPITSKTSEGLVAFGSINLTPEALKKMGLPKETCGYMQSEQGVESSFIYISPPKAHWQPSPHSVE
jgi:hypothetical protein